MKLPEELPFAILPGLSNDDRPFVKMPEEFVEAIVRHCAGVCAKNKSVPDESDWDAGFNIASDSCRRNILTAFGLKEKP